MLQLRSSYTVQMAQKWYRELSLSRL